MILLSALIAFANVNVDGFSKPVPAEIVAMCEAEVGAPYNWPDYTDGKWEHFTDCVQWRMN
jgi:hypothetical protein